MIRRTPDMREWSGQQRTQGARLGLVPTMGALHEGHLALVQAAQRQCDRVVVSIFVNPLQFGPQEDFNRYPRELASDIAKLNALGVAAVFHPEVTDMYPPGTSDTRISVEPLSRVLCGRVRPGHFAGVATVVAKLLNLVEPDSAFFGQKDWQQLVIVRTMARDLNFAVKILGVPTVREASGLARSSRNAYLSDDERDRAAAIYRGLSQARSLYQAGERGARVLTGVVTESLATVGLAPEYAELVHPESLEPLDAAGHTALLATAVPVGRTRLIDNVLLGQAPDFRCI